MRKLVALGVGTLALGLLATPTQAQAVRNAGDAPGPIDSLQDLQDTGRMLFAMADANNDGRISQQEAINAANLAVGGFFFNADRDGNGVLTQEEARQAREEFLQSKPWLRYAVETARVATRQNQGGAGNNTPNQNPMRALATAFDTNNDKQLQATELRQAVQTAVQGAFATADTDRDGQLTPAEVNAGIAGISRSVAQAAFQQADTDNNGQISQAEFERAIVQPARVAFQILDLNHDGQLSQQEAQQIRQVIASRVRTMAVHEPANSPRNAINSALGSPTQPAAGQPAAPGQPPATANPPR